MEEPEKNSTMHRLNQNPAIRWVVKHRTTLSYVFFGLLFLTLLVFRFANGRTKAASSDYIQVKRELDLLKKGDSQALNRLQILIKKHPDLQAKLDGPVAQSLILMRQMELAKPFADRSLKTLEKEDLPLYLEFADISILVADEEFELAMQKAKSLQEKLEEKPSLHFYNLLRIALLKEKLGLNPDWHSLKEHVALQKEAAFEPILSLFDETSLSLNDFIKAKSEQ